MAHKHSYLKILVTVITCITSYNLVFAPPFYRTRSQSTNAARRLINDTLIYPDYPLCIDDTYTSLNVYALFGTTFTFEPIVRSLFTPELLPQNGRQVIQITGSNVADRCEKDWLADYFGLGRSFKSNISFEPLIQTFTLEPDLFLGLNSVCGGMYVRIIAPIVHVSFDLAPLEHNIQQACEGNHPAGYFSDVRIAYQQVEEDEFNAPPGVLCTDLLCRFSQYISQGLAPDLVTPNNATAFEPLRYARFSRDRQRKTHISDIHVNLGINWIRECHQHVATEVFVAIPTGNRPEGIYVFEPVIGNGHHWELGGALDLHYQLWSNICTDRELNMYARATVSHLFATRQQRTLDIKNGPFSRYMLAKNMGQPTLNLQAGNDGNLAMPNGQFKGIFSPLANLTTTDVNVSVNAQIDGAILLNYRSGDFNGSIGYNYWHRSAETLELYECGCTELAGNQWALKGDSYTYGFVIFDEELDEELRSLPVPLSSTQSKATIHGGTNTSNSNDGVDNAELAWLTEDIQLLIQPGQPKAEDNQQRTSLQPILLSEKDLDLCTSTLPKGFTHKLFLSLNHVWQNNIDYVPYIGFGVMIESAPELNSDTGSYTDKPENSAPSQWKIWLAGGFNY